MPEQHVYEYAIIRVVPRVEREEFVNVGAILFCARLKFLQCRFHLDEEKVSIFCPQLDLEELRQHITAFEQVCKGDKNAGPIGQLDLASRFRWLTATRSTVLQPSKIHPGLCVDPLAQLESLFRKQVL